MKTFALFAIAIGIIALNGFGSADDALAPAGMVQPAYNDQGQLLRPEGYRNWVFVGSSLGLDYSRKQPDQGPGVFHHVYMQPEAYKHYKETGQFPEKTMLVMENYSSGSKEQNTTKDLTKDKVAFDNLNGSFEDSRAGVEVALKDSSKSPDKWAYFNFTTRDGLLPAAKAFPKQTCFDCHNQHAAVDNVFVQFYPVLREARAEKK